MVGNNSYLYKQIIYPLIGVEEPTTPVPSPLEIARVKVVGEDIGDDRLGDEEWNVISKAAELSKDGTGYVIVLFAVVV